MRTSKQCMKQLEPSEHFTTQKYTISQTFIQLQHDGVILAVIAAVTMKS